MIIFVMGFMGLMIAGIPGMLIGIFIGFIISKMDFTYINENRFDDSVLLRTLPILVGWITLGTDNSKSTVLNVKNFAINTFGTDRAKIFMDNFKLHINSGISYEKLRIAAGEINSTITLQTKYSIIQFLITIISNRYDFKDTDLNNLKDIAELLGVHINFERNDNYQQQNKRTIKNEKSPYEILEISETEPIDTIKKQYRKLSMQYHPDRNANLSDEERIISEVKMREINNAYEKIKFEKNIK